MSRENILLKNTLIVAIGKICTQFISFFLLPLYTAYLSTSEFGIVDLLNNFVSLLIPIIILQIDQGIFRFLIDARANEENKKSIITSCVYFVFFSILIYVLIYSFVGFFWNNDYKIFLMTNVVVTICSSVLLQISRGLGRNNIFAIGSLITALSTILFNVIFIVLCDFGAYGMLFSSCISNLFCVIYIFIKLRFYKYVSVKYYDKTILKDILKYSLPLVPNMLSWWVVNASDRSIVTIFLGASFNGIYSVSNKFSNICISFFNIFNMTWSESASTYINDPDSDQYISKIINKAFVFSCSICVCLICVIPLVFNILIDSKYALSFYQIPILIIATIFNIFSSLVGSIYVAKKKSSKIAKTSIVSAIVNILINLALINVIGLYAASISTLISFALMSVYRYIDIQNYVKLRLQKRNIIYLGSLLIVGIVSYYFNNFILSCLSALFVALCSYFMNLELIRSFVSNFKKKMVKKNV